jgi:hypothetical protein
LFPNRRFDRTSLPSCLPQPIQPGANPYAFQPRLTSLVNQGPFSCQSGIIVKGETEAMRAAMVLLGSYDGWDTQLAIGA